MSMGSVVLNEGIVARELQCWQTAGEPGSAGKTPGDEDIAPDVPPALAS
jgi:hypothetical protein